MLKQTNELINEAIARYQGYFKQPLPHLIMDFGLVKSRGGVLQKGKPGPKNQD
ncbi:MAG: hypothetical protein MZV64_50320 [Ignavibacteriales bacterium]|nr:hypothetical protein [Ignavibacteriales bacterium]